MKYIVRILVSAFAFISAAACYNNEIENPDNSQNPDQPGLRITATMAKTRVNYGNETDAQLLPVWEEGDILFGFYGDDPDDNGIVLKVCDVDEGVAELAPAIRPHVIGARQPDAAFLEIGRQADVADVDEGGNDLVPVAQHEPPVVGVDLVVADFRHDARRDDPAAVGEPLVEVGEGEFRRQGRNGCGEEGCEQDRGHIAGIIPKLRKDAA
mgnify:CR=1 FL=1